MSGAWLIISSNSGLQPRHSESESELLLHKTMGTVQEKIERCNRLGYPQSKKKSRGCLPDPGESNADPDRQARLHHPKSF